MTTTHEHEWHTLTTEPSDQYCCEYVIDTDSVDAMFARHGITIERRTEDESRNACVRFNRLERCDCGAIKASVAGYDEPLVIEAIPPGQTVTPIDFDGTKGTVTTGRDR